MVSVLILKNGQLIKKFNCPITMQQKYFNLAKDIAGSLWNGKDKITVKVEKI